MQDAQNCRADLVRRDGVDQRLRVRAFDGHPAPAYDVALDDPVAAAPVQIEPAFVERRAGRTLRVMPADQLEEGGPWPKPLEDSVWPHGYIAAR